MLGAGLLMDSLGARLWMESRVAESPMSPFPHPASPAPCAKEGLGQEREPSRSSGGPWLQPPPEPTYA